MLLEHIGSYCGDFKPYAQHATWESCAFKDPVTGDLLFTNSTGSCTEHISVDDYYLECYEVMNANTPAFSGS